MSETGGRWGHKSITLPVLTQNIFPNGKPHGKEQVKTQWSAPQLCYTAHPLWAMGSPEEGAAGLWELHVGKVGGQLQRCPGVEAKAARETLVYGVTALKERGDCRVGWRCAGTRWWTRTALHFAPRWHYQLPDFHKHRIRFHDFTVCLVLDILSGMCRVNI